ncbi:MAG: hypothetical protein HYU57_07230 [Micavibrio aeruginosavorus]|nr:hypothetical protein [Micavibrio aeruginosavorus]
MTGFMRVVFLSGLLLLSFLPGLAQAQAQDLLAQNKKVLRAMLFHCYPPIIRKTDVSEGLLRQKLRELPAEEARVYDREGGARVFLLPPQIGDGVVISYTSPEPSCAIIMRRAYSSSFWQAAETFIKPPVYTEIEKSNLPEGGIRRVFNAKIDGTPIRLLLAMRNQQRPNGVQGMIQVTRVEDQ